MDKRELKHQVKDLYNELNKHIDYSPKLVEFVLKMTKLNKEIRFKLDNKASLREIKRRKLTNEYIKKFNSFDIHEALNIEIKEAKKKIKNFDFTTKEKNIILNRFSGGAKNFLDRYNGEVIN